MKLQTVWARLVVILCLVAVAGACLFAPTYISMGEGAALKLGYGWVWDMRSSLGSMVDNRIPLVDYGRVALEVVSLTAIAGALLIIGSFVEGGKRGKQSDPVNRE